MRVLDLEKLNLQVVERNTKAIRVIGWAHLVGRGVKKDPKLFFSYMKKAADGGDVKAILQVSRAYKKGIGVKKDLDKFVEWLEKAADRDNFRAMRKLAISYRDGDGVEKDSGKFVEWLEKAANEGDTRAMIVLGVSYRDGKGVEKDSGKFVEWLEKAADKGNTRAMIVLGASYRDGNGVEKNPNKFVEWLEKAANEGDVQAMIGLGVSYRDGDGVEKNPDKFVEWFEKAVGKGNTTAMGVLGLSFREGEDVEKNPDKFVELLKKAADKGDVRAMKLLGISYRDGKDVEKNPDKFVELLKKAIDKGDDRAMIVLGASYRDGNGVEENPDKFVELLKKAADNGNVQAMMILGISYRDGNGVEKNPDKFVKWLEKAANKDDTEAMMVLGSSYRDGDGVEKNPGKFVKWLEKAADRSDPQAMRVLAKFYRKAEDIKKYEFWVRKAAELDQVESMFELAWLEKESEKPKKEREESFIFWLKKAGKHSFPYALLNLGQAYLDGCGVKKDIEKARKYFKKLEDQKEYLGFIAQGLLDLLKIQPDLSSKKISKIIDQFDELIDTVQKIKRKHEVDIFREDDSIVAHFTSHDALKSMLTEKQKNRKKTNLIRLYNASYMNDPLEGRALIEGCAILKSVFNGEEPHDHHSFKWDSEEYQLFLASFTYMKADRLDLWRAYGDDGEGFSITIPISAFKPSSEGNVFQYSNSDSDTNDDAESVKESEFLVAKRQASKLYFVRYRNTEKPSKCQIEKACKKLKKPLSKLISTLEKLDVEVKEYLTGIIKFVLSDILYLYKNEEYKSESEVRIVALEKISSDSIKLDEQKPAKLFMETEDILFRTAGSRIILGPKLKGNMEYYLNIRYLVDRAGFSDTTAVSFSEISYR